MEKPIIFFETENLIVRSIEESDKEYYMKLRVDTSAIAYLYEESSEFRDHAWDDELKSDSSIFLVAFLKEMHTFVASASFQEFNTDTIEFGIDVVKEYRNRGVGTELVFGMLKTVATLFPNASVKIRTEVSNTACRRLAEKCGFVLKGFEPTAKGRALQAVLDTFDDSMTDNVELEELRKEYIGIFEENKDGICVYIYEKK